MLKEYIIEKRKELGLSQEELAQKIGVRRSTISDFENGKSNLGYDKLEKICQLLNLQLYRKTDAYRLELWEMSVKIARLLKDKPASEVKKMSKDDMFKLTNEMFLLNYDNELLGSNLPPEEETFSYFRTLVCFNHAILLRKEEEEQK